MRRIGLVVVGVVGAAALALPLSVQPASSASSTHVAKRLAIPTLRVTRMIRGLDLPWDVKPITHGRLLITERDRKRLLLWTPGGHLRRVRFPASTVWTGSETGLMGLAIDPRFTKNADRVRNRDVIVGILSEHFLTDTADNWVSKIHAVKVPVGVINDIGRALAEPQVLARDMLVNIPHAQNPDFRMVGSPVKLSDTPVEYKRPAPMLGEHTDEVLSTRLGLSAEALELLKDKGIIEQLK